MLCSKYHVKHAKKSLPILLSQEMNIFVTAWRKGMPSLILIVYCALVDDRILCF